MPREEIDTAAAYLNQGQLALDKAELGPAATFAKLARKEVARRSRKGRTEVEASKDNRTATTVRWTGGGWQAWHPEAAELWLRAVLLIRRVDRYQDKRIGSLGLPFPVPATKPAHRSSLLAWSRVASQPDHYGKALALCRDASTSAFGHLELWRSVGFYDSYRATKFQEFLASNLFANPSAAAPAVKGLVECSAIWLQLGQRQKAMELLEVARHRAGQVADPDVMSWVDRWHAFLLMQPGGSRPAFVIDELLEASFEKRRAVRLRLIFDSFLLCHYEHFVGNKVDAARLLKDAFEDAQRAGLWMLIREGGFGAAAGSFSG